MGGNNYLIKYVAEIYLPALQNPLLHPAPPLHHPHLRRGPPRRLVPPRSSAKILPCGNSPTGEPGAQRPRANDWQGHCHIRARGCCEERVGEV
ncbi:hypothetical protein FGO68_gene6212 [Halteria grandinella]|uniref:Uncharacterized protein n=1 Tax=Halteria grandinella TaxID=5974 RepID=A0A8J8ND47_HALGN|nr:hypothetical protein FGO68_gene6212 [Halteria grandinella]